MTQGNRLLFSDQFFKVRFQYKIDISELNRRVQKANRAAIRESGKAVQREAKQIVGRQSKERRRGAGGRYVKSKRIAAGAYQPPFKRSGNLQRSIKYNVGRTVVWVGATWPKGAHGRLLTWGRSPSAKTGRMLPRPFMAPALERVRATLPQKWANRL